MSSLAARVIDGLKTPLRPAVRWWRARRYSRLYHRAMSRLHDELTRRLSPSARIRFNAEPKELWERMCDAAAPGVARREISLSSSDAAREIAAYWQRYGPSYAAIDQGREKALEHALTFALLDFSAVTRYCDVAAATSPIARALAREWPDVEHWTQDLLFETDVALQQVGGLAQEMKDIEAGFFDALTLHCSYEHFEGDGDVEFLAEVDRVLSERGACLIIPLYVADTHRVYFDPTSVPIDRVRDFDADAELRPLYSYRQEHGRFYSPEALGHRLLAKLPATLSATLLSFRDQCDVDPGIYLEFGLVLHRPDSILRGAERLP